MFGYVRPVMEALSAEDQDRFQAAYCGLCYELHERYGFAARWILNYDFTFLAILLMEEEKCTGYRCPCKGFREEQRIASNPGLSLAADESVILTYWKICDEVEDSGILKGLAWRGLRQLMKRPFQKADRLHPAFSRAVEENLNALHEMERAKAPSIDRPADAFAKILAAAADEAADEELRPIYHQLLYHLGRWIYLIDALDDLKEDASEHRYNPLIYRFHLEGDALDQDSQQRLIATMDHSVNILSSAFVLLERGPWTDLLENIIYYGLPTAGRLVLEGKWDAGFTVERCSSKRSGMLHNERMERNT